MEITINEKHTHEVQTLEVEAGVRYWEDSEVNGVTDDDGELIPCRKGDMWCPIINVNTGQILNWKQGTTANIHYKVCDDGTYTLKDKEGTVISSIDGYVPDIMCPVGNGFGDYIIMNVNEEGYINNWNVSFDEFEAP